MKDGKKVSKIHIEHLNKSYCDISYIGSNELGAIPRFDLREGDNGLNGFEFKIVHEVAEV